MRFSHALVAAVGLASKAQACLTLHAFVHNRPLMPSSCILQLWDKPEGEAEREVWKMETCDAPFFIDNEDYMCNEDSKMSPPRSFDLSAQLVGTRYVGLCLEKLSLLAQEHTNTNSRFLLRQTSTRPASRTTPRRGTSGTKVSGRLS